MLTKTIVVDGREVKLGASASTLRLYRIKFRRDLLQDMVALRKSYMVNQEEGSEFDIPELTIFENVAYIMAKQGDPDIPSDIFDWLDEFNTFSIYEILPEIFELWGLNEATLVESKKKLHQLAGGK